MAHNSIAYDTAARAPHDPAKTVDTVSQLRNICLTRLDQLQASLAEYAQQHEMLLGIQQHAKREYAQLQAVLQTIDKTEELAQGPVPGMGPKTPYGTLQDTLSRFPQEG